MRFAYADPPYPGCAHLYSDTPHVCEVNHDLLIGSLLMHYPDGWALSTSSPALQHVLGLCAGHGIAPRVMAWVKPFAAFKPNVNPAYAWEPVLVYGGRRRGRDLPTERDWLAENITLKRGLTGAKPHAFCLWVFRVLGAQSGDEMHDLFPGSGAVGRAWAAFTTGRNAEGLPLFAETV